MTPTTTWCPYCNREVVVRKDGVPQTHLRREGAEDRGFCVGSLAGVARDILNEMLVNDDKSSEVASA
jgi:hypothetical protein